MRKKIVVNNSQIFIVLSLTSVIKKNCKFIVSKFQHSWLLVFIAAKIVKIVMGWPNILLQTLTLIFI